MGERRLGREGSHQLDLSRSLVWCLDDRANSVAGYCEAEQEEEGPPLSGLHGDDRKQRWGAEGCRKAASCSLSAEDYGARP